MTINTVSKMVVTIPGCFFAVGLSDSPCGCSKPLTSGPGAVVVVVGSLLLSGGSIAVVLCLDVLALGLIPSALVLVIGEDGNVLPWGGVPVGEVVMLLSALKSITCSSGVLAGGHSTSALIDGLISKEKTLVTSTSSAGGVVRVGLVHAVVEPAVSILPVVVVGIIGVSGGADSVSSGSVSDDLFGYKHKERVECCGEETVRIQ